MARPRISQWWRDQVAAYYAENRGASAETVARAMQLKGAEAPYGEGVPPSERWIREFVSTLADEHLLPLRYLRWPESFEVGLLPWESARVVLPLLGDGRPLVRYARWFWRITVSAPDLDEGWRRVLARIMSAVEAGVIPDFHQSAVESVLMRRMEITDKAITDALAGLGDAAIAGARPDSADAKPKQRSTPSTSPARTRKRRTDGD